MASFEFYKVETYKTIFVVALNNSKYHIEQRHYLPVYDRLQSAKPYLT